MLGTQQQMPVWALGRALKVLQGADKRTFSEALTSTAGSGSDALLDALATVKSYARSREDVREVGEEHPLCLSLLQAVRSKDTRQRSRTLQLLQWLVHQPGCAGMAGHLASYLRSSDKALHLAACVTLRAVIEGQAPRAGGEHELDAALVAAGPHWLALLADIAQPPAAPGVQPALPTRLTSAAADCMLVLTGALATSAPAASPDRPFLLPATDDTAATSSSPGIAQAAMSASSAVAAVLGCAPLLLRLLDALGGWCRAQLDGSAAEAGAQALWDPGGAVAAAGRVYLAALQAAQQRLRAACAGAVAPGAGNEQSAERAAAALCRCWALWAPLLLMEQGASKGLVAQQREAVKVGLASASGRAQNTSQDLVSGLLIGLGLAVSQAHAAALDTWVQLLRADGLEVLLPLDDPPDAAPLKLALLRLAVARHVVSTVTGQPGAPATAAAATVEFGLSLAAAGPAGAAAGARLLITVDASASAGLKDEVVRRLQPGQQVPADLLRMCAATVQAEAGQDHQAWTAALTPVLVEQAMTSSGATVSDVAAEAVLLLAPDAVVSHLVQALSSDGKEPQLAARRLLLRYLRDHPSKAEAVAALLENVQTAPPAAAQAALAVLPDWAEGVRPGPHWPGIIAVFLAAAAAAPASAALVQALRSISSPLAQHHSAVFRHIAAQLDRQPRQPIHASLASKAAAGTQPAPGPGAAAELFERLQPLLVLRLLPLEPFDDRTCQHLYGPWATPIACAVVATNTTEIAGADAAPGDAAAETHGQGSCGVAQHLLQRMGGEGEYEQVRRVAAELAGRLHPHLLLPHLLQMLQAGVASGDMMAVRGSLFVAVAALRLRGAAAVLSAQRQTLADGILSAISTVLLWPQGLPSSCISGELEPSADEIKKAQLGCIDVLALLAAAELNSNAQAEPQGPGVGSALPVRPLKVLQGPSIIVEDITDLPPDSSMAQAEAEPGVVAAALGCLTGQRRGVPWRGISSQLMEAPTSMRICMANVLITLSREVTSPAAQQALSRRVLAPLLAAATAQRVQDNVEVGAAVMQVLFTSVHAAGAAGVPLAAGLMSLTLQRLGAVEAASPERQAAVRLLMALLAGGDEALQAVQMQLPAAKGALEAAARAEPTSPLRLLCSQLLQCMS